METSLQFEIIPVAAILGEAGPVQALIDRYMAALAQIGGKLPEPGSAGMPDLSCYFVATGGTEQEILRLHVRDLGARVLLVAHSTHNSLPAALEVLARFHQMGIPGEIVFLEAPTDTAGLARLVEALHGLSVWRALQQAQIGMVGNPSDWLVASSPTGEMIRERWGPWVIPVAWRELTELLPAGETAASKSSVWELQATGCDPEAKTGLPEALKVVAALQQLVAYHKLDAVTMRCFDLVLQLRTTGCLALAQLNAEGVVAGCEGDLVSTLGMLWSYLLTGELPWMANPATVDVAGNRLGVAHCTVTPGLISSYRLRTHFESGLGVALAGEWIAGPVTLFRLGGKRLERLWAVEGDATAGPGSEELCRTQVQISLTRGRVDELLRTPLGNHLVVVPGRHAERLENWHRQYGPGAELREVVG